MNLIQQLPYALLPLIVYLVGIVLSLVYLKRFTKPAVLVLNASILLFSVTLCMPLINGYFFGYRSGFGVLQRNILMVVKVVDILIRSVAFCLLLVAAFIGRRTNSSDHFPEGKSLESYRGIIVLEFGILSVVFFPPIGIAAWLMGSYDLSAMRTGRMDRYGESITRVGYILGIIGTIFLGVAIAIAYASAYWIR